MLYPRNMNTSGQPWPNVIQIVGQTTAQRNFAYGLKVVSTSWLSVGATRNIFDHDRCDTVSPTRGFSAVCKKRHEKTKFIKKL